jgi:hypothetical protein
MVASGSSCIGADESGMRPGAQPGELSQVPTDASRGPPDRSSTLREAAASRRHKIIRGGPVWPTPTAANGAELMASDAVRVFLADA